MRHGHEYQPWDITVTFAKEYLARLMRAIVTYDVKLTDSFMAREPSTATHREWVYLRLQIPTEHAEAFRADVNPIEMRPPPPVDLGWSCP